jgi:hypothetical protein
MPFAVNEHKKARVAREPRDLSRHAARTPISPPVFYQNLKQNHEPLFLGIVLVSFDPYNVLVLGSSKK